MKEYLTNATDFLNEFKMFILAIFSVVATMGLGLDNYLSYMAKHGISQAHALLALVALLMIGAMIFGGVLFLRCYVKKTNETNRLLHKNNELQERNLNGEGCRAKK